MIEIVDMIDGKWEYEYFEEIIKNIDLEEDLTFVFLKWEDEVPDTNYPAVLFVTSDEHHQCLSKFPEHPNVKMVFKNYFPKGERHPKMRPLPLGYLQGFCADGVTKMSDRVVEYSFSGTVNNSGREVLHESLMELKEDGRRKYIDFYTGWAKGLDMTQYSELMNNTQVALCPHGYVSSETFRYFEAAKAGCVILSEAKPDVWYYEGAPHVLIHDWTELSETLDNLLSQPELLEQKRQETLDWWNEKCSPVAVANYIMKELENAKTES